MDLTIDDFIETLPYVTLADPKSEKDNKDILKFFKRTQMETDGVAVEYDRSPDFFKFLDMQFKRYYVFIFRIKPEGDIYGSATIGIRDGYIKGEIEEIAYFGDLRMAKKRKIRLLWKNNYNQMLDALTSIEELKHIKHIYTAIMGENSAAIRSLIKNKKNTFSYLPMHHFNMVNIIMKKPLKKDPNTLKLKVRFATQKDSEYVFNFLDQEQKKRAFGYPFTKSYTDNRLKTWPGLKIVDFIIIERDKKIIGACNLWAPDKFKRINLTSLTKSLKIVSKFMNVFKDFPRIGEPLKILYINNFEIDGKNKREKSLILNTLLHFIFTHKKKYSFHQVAFKDIHIENLSKSLNNFYVQKESINVYQVITKGNELYNLQLQLPESFEMSLV